MGFEPMRELSPPNRLAGGRTRPLCDPSCLYTTNIAEAAKGYKASDAEVTERRIRETIQYIQDAETLAEA